MRVRRAAGARRTRFPAVGVGQELLRLHVLIHFSRHRIHGFARDQTFLPDAALRFRPTRDPP